MKISSGDSLIKNAPLVSLVLGTVVMSIYSLSQNSLATLMAYILFGLAGAATARLCGSTPLRIYSIVYGVTSAAAVGLAVIYAAAYGTPYWAGGSDELFYESSALEFAHRFSILDYGSIKGHIVSEWESTTGYIYLMALLVRFGDLFDGFHTMVPRLFNTMCLSLISVLIYFTGLKIRLKRETAVYAALFTGMFPMLMWTAVQSLRDIMQALLILTVLYMWMPAPEKGRASSILIRIVFSAVLLIPIWEIRKAQALLVLIIVLASFVLNSKIQKNGLSKVPLLIAVGLLVPSGLLFLSIFQDEIVIYMEAANHYAEYQAAGGTAMESGMSRIIFEMPIFPLGWLLRSAYALASPLPVSYWPLHNAWLSIGTLIQILMVPYLLIGAWAAIRTEQTRTLIFSFFAFFASMAMFTFTIRHSVYWIILAGPIMALGYERYRGSHSKVLIRTFTATSCLGILYLLLMLR